MLTVAIAFCEAVFDKKAIGVLDTFPVTSEYAKYFVGFELN